MTRFLSLRPLVLLAALLLVGVASTLYAQTINTFDPPDSIFTRPTAINLAGQITGYYSSNVPFDLPHSFLRQPDGTMITFTVTVPAFIDNAFAMDINPLGQIAGWYYQSLGPTVTGAFLRQADGTIIGFSGTADHPTPTTPFAAAESQEPAPRESCLGDGSMAVAINAAGQITGSTANVWCVGFLRQPDGDNINFGVPPSDGGPSNTRPQAINLKGQITGDYRDLNPSYRGFLRQPDGAIIRIDVPNALATFPRAINKKGEITGYYEDSNSSHGFLRRRNGTIVSFDPMGSTYTQATSINLAGQITGFYLTADGTYHGFVRVRSGKFTTFDAPGAATGNFRGTFPQAINKRGQITGYYQDENLVLHGFIRSPR